MTPYQGLGPVLIADNNTNDCLIAMEAWEEAGLGNHLRFVQDGRELLDYLYHRHQYAAPPSSPCPGLILLTLSLLHPKKDWDTLKAIKADGTLKDIPIIVLSRSRTSQDASEAYAFGAYGFVMKPFTLHEYLNVMREIRQTWLDLRGSSTPSCPAI